MTDPVGELAQDEQGLWRREGASMSGEVRVCGLTVYM